MMFRKVFATTGIVLAVAVSGSAREARPRAPSFDQIQGVPVRVDAFFATATGGTYASGERPRFELYAVCTNEVKGTLDVTVDVCGLGRAKASAVSQGRMPFSSSMKTSFDLPAAGKPGFYAVTARYSWKGKACGHTTASYVVLPPEPQQRDPFFMIDKNCAVETLCKVMKRGGFGALFLSVPGTSYVLTHTQDELESDYHQYERANRTGFLANDDFVLRAAADPAVRDMKRAHERLDNRLPPVSDDDLLKVRRHFERIGTLLADRVTEWAIQEEIDAIPSRPDCWPHWIQYLSSYALIARNIYAGLKAGNPSCVVGAPGICCYDYDHSPTPFHYTKLVLNSMKDSFDCVALDAYSGGWEGTLQRYTPPEKKLKQLLKDGAALSAEYGKKRVVWNVERSCTVEYAASPDSQAAIDQAEHNVRSMIINRSVTESPFYTFHLLAYAYPAQQWAKDRSRRDISDLGIWKVVFVPGSNDVRYVPRPSVAAICTVSRKLAFVSDPIEKVGEDGVRLVAFACEGTRKGRAVMPVWTVDDAPKTVSVVFPAEAVVTRFDGDERVVPAGKWSFTASSSPCYLEFPESAREAFLRAFESRMVK